MRGRSQYALWHLTACCGGPKLGSYTMAFCSVNVWWLDGRGEDADLLLSGRSGDRGETCVRFGGGRDVVRDC